MGVVVLSLREYKFRYSIPQFTNKLIMVTIISEWRKCDTACAADFVLSPLMQKEFENLVLKTTIFWLNAVFSAPLNGPRRRELTRSIYIWCRLENADLFRNDRPLFCINSDE